MYMCVTVLRYVSVCLIALQKLLLLFVYPRPAECSKSIEKSRYATLFAQSVCPPFVCTPYPVDKKVGIGGMGWCEATGVPLLM